MRDLIKRMFEEEMGGTYSGDAFADKVMAEIKSQSEAMFEAAGHALQSRGEAVAWPPICAAVEAALAAVK